ncbi:MAG: HAD family hydrolase [Lentisphaeria bacterium]|nr:HAD family hydrolase [Lentisphaeria bacterium]
MRRAIFLDRDGVVNEEVDFLHRPEDVVLIPGLGEAIGKIHAAGCLAIVISNQSGVARGMFGMDAVKAVEARICELLRQAGSEVPDAFYYCPHHVKGTVPELSFECNCRKPKPGMFLQAIREWGIDPAVSSMIGDRLSDLQAAKAAGCADGVLVETGYGKNLVDQAAAEGWHVEPSVLPAVEYLLKK